MVAAFARPRAAFEVGADLVSGPLAPVFVDVLAGACGVQLAVGFEGREQRVDGLLQRARELAGCAGAEGTLVLTEPADATLRRRLDDPLARSDDALDDGLSAATDAQQSSTPRGPRAVLRVTGTHGALCSWIERSLAGASDQTALRFDARPGLGLLFADVTAHDEPALLATTSALLDDARREGHATLVAAPPALRADPALVWGRPGADFPLRVAIKRALDPDGVLAAGRFVGGL